MKLFKTYFSIYIIFFLSINIYAQFPSGYGWKVPRKSPKASVEQIVGVTAIKVEYSRPLVNKRTIFGKDGLIKNDKVWRAGANEATTISFTTDVIIDTVTVKQGKYALFVVPKDKMYWELILNDIPNQWGAFTRKPAHDILKIKVKTTDVLKQNALLYWFSEINSNSTTLNLSWDTKKIDIPIKVDLEKTIKTSTESVFDWQAGFFAAEFYLKELKNYEEALKWINASLALNNNLSSLHLKATIFSKQQKWKDAITIGNEILSIAKSKNNSFYTKQYKTLLKEWKEK